jgi:hypothetical protein
MKSLNKSFIKEVKNLDQENSSQIKWQKEDSRDKLKN